MVLALAKALLYQDSKTGGTLTRSLKIWPKAMIVRNGTP